jgi:opine dehydrogenase
MYGRLAHDKLVDSGDWHEHLDLSSHRYMLEDVGMGLAFLVSVGVWVDTPCPVAAGLLAIAGAANGEAFRGRTRTLQSLGLAGHSRDGMRDLLWKGI